MEWRWERAPFWCAEVSTPRNSEHSLDYEWWAVRSHKKPSAAEFKDLMMDKLGEDIDAAIEEDGMEVVKKELLSLAEGYYPGRRIDLDNHNDGYGLAYAIEAITDGVAVNEGSVYRIRLSRTEREEALKTDTSFGRLAEFCSW